MIGAPPCNRVILTLFVLLFVQHVTAQLKAEAGLVDARVWNFTDHRLPLTGEWTFFKDKLYNEQQCKTHHGIDTSYPSLWNTPDHDGTGYGTYYLQVIVPDSIHTFCMEIPQVYSSLALWVNGKRIAGAGKVGKTKEQTSPRWLYQTASFTNLHDTLHIVLQLANFHHYKGGAKDPIILGIPKQIHQHKIWAIGTSVAEIFLLFIIGSVFLILYFKSRNKKVILYFSLLCFTWGLRAAFSNLYPVVYIFPNINWVVQVKIEYLTLYGGVVWCILFLNHLFNNISNKSVMYMLVGVNIFFTVFTLATPPLVFSQWVSVYLTVAGITIGYSVIIVIRALFYDQAGAGVFSISLLLGGVVFGYDILAYGKAGYNLVFLNIGYIVIFSLVTIDMLYHLGILKRKGGYNDMLTYSDMFGDSNSGKK